eukprot:scaffold4058_cov214-Chaetoceros_neogracile.AAC.1
MILSRKGITETKEQQRRRNSRFYQRCKILEYDRELGDYSHFKPYEAGQISSGIVEFRSKYIIVNESMPFSLNGGD